MPRLDNTLRIGASDLHVKVGTAPRIRVSGRLVELPGSSPVSPEEAAGVQRQVITSEPKRSELDRNGSADTSHVREGRISRSEAMAYASEPHDFGLALQQAGVPLGASNGR